MACQRNLWSGVMLLLLHTSPALLSASTVSRERSTMDNTRDLWVVSTLHLRYYLCIALVSKQWKAEPWNVDLCTMPRLESYPLLIRNLHWEGACPLPSPVCIHIRSHVVKMSTTSVQRIWLRKPQAQSVRSTAEKLTIYNNSNAVLLRGSIFTGSAYSVVMNSGIFMPYMYLYICNILFRLIPTCTFATRSSHGVSTLLSNSQSPSQPLLSAAPYPEPSDTFPGMHCFTTEKVSWLRGFYSM